MRRSLLVVALMLASAGARGGDFVVEVDAPKFRVTLPDILRMKLEAHPLHASKPHLRLLGTEGPYTVSVMTPTADAGMSALECASATLGSIVQRPGVPPRDQIYKVRLNERTFAAIYSSPLPSSMQLNAHLMSAAGGTHCVEVHASRVSTSSEDVDGWFKAFEKADIAAQ
jgi:hypothetical protein